MLEYKREKTRLETRLEDLSKQYEHYDEHLRVIDAWWLQVGYKFLSRASLTLLTSRSYCRKSSCLLKARLLTTATMEVCLPIPLTQATSMKLTSTQDFKPFTGLCFEDVQTFEAHLSEKAHKIKPILESLFSRIAANRGDVKPEVAELERKLKTLLATQKEDKVQLEGLIHKKDELSASLDAAMLRAVKAEKKLDRAKSAQVQKMEAQAMGQATTRPAPSEDEKKNGDEPSHSNGHDAGLQLKYEEAAAAEAKLKEQLSAAMAELKALKDENSTLKMRRDSVTDEDYVRTDVFKAFKGQNEDLIKRVNDLEVINKQLRHEAEKLQAERTAFRTQLEREAQAVTEDLEAQIQARDGDLTRIRTARDELLADVGVRQKTMELEKTSIENMKELVASKEDRILALEMELERLRPDAATTMSDPDPELDSITIEDLREKFVKCRKDLESIKQELPAIEKAYKRAMTLSQKKVMDQVAAEERMTQLVQEKSKADQKYFAARKDADIRNNEIKTLRQQNGKSSEIITALKEHDTQARTLNSNLEKQLMDLKQSNIAILDENRTLKSTATDAARRADQVKSQVGELQSLVKSKDSMVVAVKEQANIYQVEVEKLKKRVESVSKERDTLKRKGMDNVSPDEELLNDMIWCKVCKYHVYLPRSPRFWSRATWKYLLPHRNTLTYMLS